MNYKHQVLFFNIIFLLILLAATVLFETNPGLAGSQLKPLDILSDVISDSSHHSPVNNKNSVTGKLNHTKTRAVQRDYTSYNGLINSSSNPTALSEFFRSLHDLVKKKRKKVRIAYFGDSMEEGDLVTQDLRRMLQDSFGGSGVGFVPVTSIVAGFRQTIIHSFSSNWDDINFKSANKASANLFISGHSFFSDANSVVTYRAVNQPRLNNFSKVSVLFGSPAAGNNNDATILANGTPYPVKATEPVNILNLSLNTNELKLGISSTTVPLYGAAFEADTGVVVDNFAFRGISGIEMDYFSEKYLHSVQSARPYDLLIFHYGPNLLFRPNLIDFTWYARKMQPTLQKIKNAFPQTSILVISTADKGSRYNGEWHTQKGVRPLIDVQYTMAGNAGADFFNLFNAMGGEDAIVRWVNAEPALANRDYTHANHNGAKKIGEMIYNAIMKEYKEYERSAAK